jgi:hypothetical protein
MCREGAVPTDKQMLKTFVHIGQEILSCDDWAAHYGSSGNARVAPSPPGVGYAQPGFVGRDYRGLVIVNQNPSAGFGRDDVHRDWERAFRKWHNQGTVDVYLETFRFWQSDVHAWKVWTQWVEPILYRLRPRLTEDHIGYLNLCKNATIPNKAPTERMYRSDWEWTGRQLTLLQPRVVVAGGKEVAKQLNTLWPAPPVKVLVQDRNRNQSGAVRASEANRLAGEIRKALQ